MPSTSPTGPPEDLAPDEHLEVAPADWDPRQVYFLMTGLVVPRPIAWVSTLSAEGVANVAPHSYFNTVGHDPPHVVIGSSGRKDTLRNVEATGELVVNITTEHVLEAMNATSVDAPHGVDEFELVDVTKAPSEVVAPPRVAEAVAHLEARVAQVVPAGASSVILAEVVHVHVDPRVWRDGRVDPELLRPLLRFAGTTYGTVGEVFKLPRPAWGDVADRVAAGDDSWIPRRPGSPRETGDASQEPT